MLTFFIFSPADEVHAFLFTDVQRNVVDESAFNIPSACAAVSIFLLLSIHPLF